MEKIKISLLVKLLLLFLSILLYFSLNYEYNEKVLISGHINYERESKIYSPVNGNISKINYDTKNGDRTIFEIVNFYDSNLSLNEMVNNLNLSKNSSILVEPIVAWEILVPSVKVGDSVKQGECLGKIILSSKMIVRIKVGSEQFIPLKIGDLVAYQVKSLPFSEYGFFEGKVIDIADNYDVDSKNSYSRIIDIDIASNSKDENNLALLNDGMVVDVYVSRGKKKLSDLFFPSVARDAEYKNGMSEL